MVIELKGIDEQAFKIGELVEHDGPERKIETELYRTTYGYEKKMTVTSYEIADDVFSTSYRYGEKNSQTKFYALNKDDALKIAVEPDFKFNVPFSGVFNKSEFFELGRQKLPVLTLGTKGNITIPDAKDIDKYLSEHTLLVSLGAISKTDLSDKLDQEHIYIKDGLYTVKTERDYSGDMVTYLDDNLSMTKNEVISKFKEQMQELNYYINDKKIGLSEIEKILDTNHQNKFNQINNLNKTTMENQKVTGFMGKDFRYSDKGKTPVASFQLGETKNGVTTWTNVKAFGETAIQIKAAKENGIKKYQVEGPLKDDKPYTKADGSTVTPKALTVQSLQYYQLQELSGVIAKAENKETKAGKEYIALYVKNKVDKGGVQQTMDYNIKIYPPVSAPKRTNPDGTEWKLESGQPVAIKGEVATSFYIKDNELKTGQNITAWNVDRTLTLLHGQIKEKQESQGLSL